MKAFDRTLYPFMIKLLIKLGIEGDFLIAKKGIHEELSYILNA